jgi:hypothetical protein
MKKIILFSVFFILGMQLAKAQYPIPSYNALVDERATFMEGIDTTGLTGGVQFTDKRRVMYIECNPAKTSLGDAAVWAYTLDHTTVLGPYPLYFGQVLQIDIDEREWGVLVSTKVEIVVDVWIEE